MKTRILIWSLVTVTFSGLMSCSAIFSGMYGMKKTKALDEKTILRFAEKYNIPVADCYELDETYFSYLLSLDSVRYSEEVKNHSQPLQALYYDRSGHLKSFQVNCYAGGFPNLKWNRNEIMSTFPPKQQAPIDSIVSLETQMKYLKPFSQTEKINDISYDYIVVVYWSRFMGRQSKRLVRFVQENSTLKAEKKVKIIYVNTDSIFAKE